MNSDVSFLSSSCELAFRRFEIFSLVCFRDYTVISDENLEFVIIVELDYGANGRHRVELELFKAFAVAFAQ